MILHTLYDLAIHRPAHARLLAMRAGYAHASTALELGRYYSPFLGIPLRLARADARRNRPWKPSLRR